MNYTTLARTTEPPAEPISIEDAKLAVRVDDDLVEDLELLQAYIVAARERVEDITGRALVEQSWTMKLADWPVHPVEKRRRIDLPKPPLVSVTSVSYVDSAGATQVLATTEYAVHADKHAAYIVEAYGKTWPPTRMQDDAITVVFLAGYPKHGTGDATDYRRNIPQAIRTAVKQLVQGQYEHLKAEDREALEQQVRNFLSGHRVHHLG